MPLRKNIRITNLYLDIHNPRQETNSQEEAIEWLCINEKIDELMQDIVDNGINPLELIGVFEAERDLWFALEGNRRICALKLLNEPELAPTVKLKQKIQKLKSEWQNPITEVECVCFSSREDADIWLDRLHQGEQDGIGRTQWNPFQKSRRSDKPENKRALLVLDYAKHKGWVSDSDISNKLTTATRYLNNEALRKILGLDGDIANLKRTRPLDVFNKLLEEFISDLNNSSVDGWVSSRGNKTKIEEYANHLDSTISDRTIHEAESVFPVVSAPPVKPPKQQKPKRPPAPPKLSISHNQDLEYWLKAHGNTKLNSLYYSLCMLDLNDNNYTPLVTVGAWSFVESLTRDCGRDEKPDFATFVSTKIQHNRDFDKKAIHKALKELSELGNLTKHNGTYANFNGETIATIMNTVTPALISLLDEQVRSNEPKTN